MPSSLWVCTLFSPFIFFLIDIPSSQRNPFSLSHEDWYAWEQLWKLYMSERENNLVERSELQRLFVEELSDTLS